MSDAPRNKGTKMYSISDKILRRLPAACPLCDMGARGGDLCSGCALDLSNSLNDRARCQHCFEAVAESARAERAAVTATPMTVRTQAPKPIVHCLRCASHPPAYASLVAAIEYTYPGDMLIQRFKDGARLAYAGMFARLLWRRLQTRSSRYQACAPLGALVPIPASQSALRRRGFNPAQELARELARLSGYPLRQGWLTRTREACTQRRSMPVRVAKVSRAYTPAQLLCPTFGWAWLTTSSRRAARYIPRQWPYSVRVLRGSWG